MVDTARAEQANAYMKEKMLFTPRMFQIINTVAPETGERFADFYDSVWQDGALSRKVKELMFTAIPVLGQNTLMYLVVVHPLLAVRPQPADCPALTQNCWPDWNPDASLSPDAPAHRPQTLAPPPTCTDPLVTLIFHAVAACVLLFIVGS